MFFLEISPKSVYPPTPGFLLDLGDRKVKFGLKKAIFGVIWGGFEGFGPCLGITHPTHPHWQPQISLPVPGSQKAFPTHP